MDIYYILKIIFYCIRNHFKEISTIYSWIDKGITKYEVCINKDRVIIIINEYKKYVEIFNCTYRMRRRIETYEDFFALNIKKWDVGIYFNSNI